MTVVLDDHLLRDWLRTSRDRDLIDAVGDEDVATTNLWYARLCRSANASSGGALLGGWTVLARRDVLAGLIRLPSDVTIVPMRRLAWRMGQLATDHTGLSTLGAEAVAAAVAVGGRLLVSARDDGPGIRRCADALGVDYETLAR